MVVLSDVADIQNANIHIHYKARKKFECFRGCQKALKM